MAQVPSIKRIVTEDYDKQYSDLINKLGYSVNTFADSVTSAFQHAITFEDNINSFKKTLSVMVDSSGNPTTQTQFKSSLSSNPYGIVVLSATNTTNAKIYPTSQPFISYSVANGLITINNITGLTAKNTYSLNLLILG